MTESFTASPVIYVPDDTSISLGSCRSFYKELPAQIDVQPMSHQPDRSVSSSSGSARSAQLDAFLEKSKARDSAIKKSPATLPTQDPSSSEDNGSTISSDVPSTFDRRQLVREFALDYEDEDDDDDEESYDQDVNLDHVQVAIRLRPAEETLPGRRLSRRRTNSSLRGLMHASSDDGSAWIVDPKERSLTQKASGRKINGRNFFAFDAIYDETVGTARLYRQAFQPTVRAVLTGRHATIFAYGQTGSGKTYTMQGDDSNGVDGLIQLAAADLFEQVKEESDREYTVRAKYFEIYNEQIRDLLMSDASCALATGAAAECRNAMRRASMDRRLQIREGKDGNPTVDAYEEEVYSVDDVLRLLKEGTINRAREATLLNDNSSRSHAIFRLTLESRKPGEATKRVAVLNLVDLAGSENSTSSGSSGMRLREGGKINQSLLSLSRVIHSLSLPANKRPKHIGYRDSNLTRILQPHLSGNACMAVVCCISPSPVHVEETRSTLKFALRAKQVEMSARVNEVVDRSAQVSNLQKELAETKQALVELEKCFLHQLTKSRGSPSKWLRLAMCAGAKDSSESDYDSSSGASSSGADDEDSCDDTGSTDSSNAVAGMGDNDLNETMTQIVPYTGNQSNPPLGEVLVRKGKPVKLSEVRMRLLDAENRAMFLEEKLEITDDLVETLFMELEHLRRFNIDLKGRNDQLTMATVRRDEDESDIILLIKYTFYLGFNFYLFGQNELFLATMMFIWLSLEVAI